MTKYEVVKEDGVELNGADYKKGHTFEFETEPEYITKAVEEGSVKVLDEDESEDEESDESESSEEKGNDAEEKTAE